MSINYNLDVRCYEILEYLLYKEEYVNVQQLADEKGISRRSVYYDIHKINEWLEDQGILAIEIERKKGILIDKERKEIIRSKLQKISPKAAYVFTPVERLKIIICSVLQRNRVLRIEDFMDLCQVSRNTTINDLKEADKVISKYQLQLVYENGKGYHIVGDLVRKRTVYFLYFNSIADFYKREILPLDNRDKVQQILGNLIDIEAALGTQYVQGVLFTIAVFFSTIENRTDVLNFSEKEKSEITNTIEYGLVHERFCDLEESEQLYLTLHLLGSRMQSSSVNFANDETGKEAKSLSIILVQAFSRIAGIEFVREQELIQAIATHLSTSLYRYRYGIQLGNPMLDNIKTQYGDLFEITSRACKYLEKEIGVPIPEGEVAYITLHFGAFITSGHHREQKLKILIVCPNGVSTANMLRGEIQTLVPNAEKVDILAIKDYRHLHDYNVVISTVILEDEANLILVHPILTDQDRIAILKRCMKFENQHNVDVLEIVKIASQYLPNKNLQNFKTDLIEYFSNASMKSILKNNYQSKGICQMLSEQYINIVYGKNTWRESIRISGKGLLESNIITMPYIDSIIHKTIKYGPYMFITDHVFLAHSEIEDGANQLGISLTVFKNPVEFITLDGQIRNAKIIMTLAAEDQATHIRLLNDIMTIFEVKENAERIWNADSIDEIQKIIRDIVQEEV